MGRLRWGLKQILFIGIPLCFFLLWPKLPIGEKSLLSWRDLLYTIRETQSQPPDVIVVAIDDPSFKHIQLPWPWPRSLHAKLIDQLHAWGARAIVFDVVFAEPTDPAEDQALADAAVNAGTVILGAHKTLIERRLYWEYETVEPFPLLKKAAREVAVVNFIPDADAYLRHGIIERDGMNSLAFAAAKIAGKKTKADLPEALLADVNTSFLIDFAGPPGSIKTVSYYQVINGDLPKSFFDGKVVFVGKSSDTALEIERAVDAFPTPFLSIGRKMMFGVEIHANAYETILKDFPLNALSSDILWPVTVLVLLFPIIARKKPVLLVSLTSGTVILPALISIFLFQYYGLVLDVLPLVLTAFINGSWCGIRQYRDTAKEKRQLKGAFESYVAPDLVNELLRNPELLRLGGQKKELTVLFSDIRGFTTLSESLAPERLVSLLNDYLSEMTDKVFDNNGTLDKYIGDALMAIFGAPLPREDHAECAARTALGMVGALKKIKADWAANALPEPKIGIGINTGPMVVGNIGSHRRFDYTVIGDEVNLSSRLEGISKTYRTTVIVSETTQKRVADKFVFRELDAVIVKGKATPITIYELLADISDLDEYKEFLSIFASGLASYRQRSFAKAIEQFKALLTIEPADGPSSMFVERCETFIKEPPPEDWDGVWVMSTK